MEAIPTSAWLSWRPEPELLVTILVVSLLVVLNLPRGSRRAAAGLGLAALGTTALGQATTVDAMLLGLALTIAGGTLATRLALVPDAEPAGPGVVADPAAAAGARRWHATATFGFALAAVGAALFSGLGGSLTLAVALDDLVARPAPLPLAVPVALTLLGVGLGLALLGEPGRLGGAMPPALIGWFTTVPALALVAFLARLLATPAAASMSPLVTAAAALLVLAGFLAATVQPNLERRLAWAASGQVGLALFGCAALGQDGADAARQHMLFFVPAQLAALLVAGVVSTLPTDLRRRHLLAFLLAALLLALAALPPLAGWRPRLELVQVLVAADRGPTAALVLAGTLLGCVVYLRPLVDLWRPPAGSDATGDAMPTGPVLTAAALLALLLAWGLGLST